MGKLRLIELKLGEYKDLSKYGKETETEFIYNTHC